MTRNDLKQYILRKLGSPVINVEISKSQLDDAIDDALQKFHENHFDGVDVGYLLLPIEKDNQEYVLDDEIFEVTDILGPDVFSYSGDPLLIRESLQFGNSLSLMSEVDLIGIEVWRQNIKNLENAFNKEILFDFNSTTKKLFLHVNPLIDTTFALKVYKSENADDIEDSNLYNNIWLKKYSVALAKYQWGTNIQKYESIALPGGGSINFRDIMTQATESIDKLETELDERYSEPYDLFVG